MGFSQWLWVQKGLLRDDSGIIFPSCNGTESDPYFNGTAAINAFDNVGGSGYGGNKVPVEEVGGPGTWCAHWRELVFETELMTGFISLPGTANPLSEVSVEAFADVGYLVDPSGADPYTLPGSAPVASQTRGRQLVELVEIGPIFAIDEQGRVTVVRQDRR